MGPSDSVAERPGWNQAGRAALEHERGGGADGGERGLGVGAGVPEVDGAAGAVRVARGGGAGAQAGGEQGLLAGLAAGEDLADLEEGEVGVAAGLVAGGGAQEAGQEVGAEVAHLRGDRVLQADRLAAAEEGGGGGVDEAVGDGLVVAEGGDAAAGLALAALHGGEDRAGHAGGAGQRAALEPGERGDAGDLLDEVGVALHVGAPGGGRGAAPSRVKPRAARMRACSGAGRSMPTRRVMRAGSKR